jgi:hypothetical protein
MNFLKSHLYRSNLVEAIVVGWGLVVLLNLT